MLQLCTVYRSDGYGTVASIGCSVAVITALIEEVIISQCGFSLLTSYFVFLRWYFGAVIHVSTVDFVCLLGYSRCLQLLKIFRIWGTKYLLEKREVFNWSCRKFLCRLKQWHPIIKHSCSPVRTAPNPLPKTDLEIPQSVISICQSSSSHVPWEQFMNCLLYNKQQARCVVNINIETCTVEMWSIGPVYTLSPKFAFMFVKSAMFSGAGKWTECCHKLQCWLLPTLA